MEWEAAWIRNNLNRYESRGHAEAVILNIQKRRKIVELEQQVKKYKEQLGIE